MSYTYIGMDSVITKFNCNCCKSVINYPKWMAEKYKIIGKCMDCVISACDGACNKKTVPRGYCAHCGGKLVPIGTSRMNGKSHDDWGTRKMHKKCWKEFNSF